MIFHCSEPYLLAFVVCLETIVNRSTLILKLNSGDGGRQLKMMANSKSQAVSQTTYGRADDKVKHYIAQTFTFM